MAMQPGHGVLRELLRTLAHIILLLLLILQDGNAGNVFEVNHMPVDADMTLVMVKEKEDEITKQVSCNMRW